MIIERRLKIELRGSRQYSKGWFLRNRLHGRTLKQMSCDEKLRLATIYEAATAKFSSAVKELQQKTGISARQEYERRYRAANEGRVKSEQARFALEQHIATNRC